MHGPLLLKASKEIKCWEEGKSWIGPFILMSQFLFFWALFDYIQQQNISCFFETYLNLSVFYHLFIFIWVSHCQNNSEKNCNCHTLITHTKYTLSDLNVHCIGPLSSQKSIGAFMLFLHYSYSKKYILHICRHWMLYKNLLTLKLRTKSKETEFVYLNLCTSMYVGNRHFTKVLQINCSITYYFNPMYDNIPFNAISVVSCMAYDSYNLHPLAADKFLCSPNHLILGNALFIFLCYFQTLN